MRSKAHPYVMSPLHALETNGYYPGAYILLKGLKRHMRLGTLKCQWCPYPLNYS